MRTVAIVVASVFIIVLQACSSSKADSWQEVVEEVAKMDSTTGYDEIVNRLGKPYSEFATPSLLEEYVLYYDVPGEPGKMYFIMLDTETKRFVYWGNSKQEKHD